MTATSRRKGFKLGLFWFAIAAAGLMLPWAARFCLENNLGWRCPSLVLLHVPCPSCGSTRALAALAELDFWRAARMNPLLVGALAALALAGARLLRLETLGRMGWTGFFAAILLNWVYLLLFLPR